MNDGYLVKVAQTDQDFPSNDRGILVLEAAVLGCSHEGINTTALSKLHDNPNARPIHVAAEVLCNIGYVAELTEESDLALDVGYIIIRSVEVNDFKGDGISGWDVPASVNCPVATLSNCIETFIELVDRRLAHNSLPAAPSVTFSIQICHASHLSSWFKCF